MAKWTEQELRTTGMINELPMYRVLRCRHVRRWHIIHIAREQTVAEHQWAVTMLSWELCERLQVALDPIDMLRLIRWALTHDVPEVVLGDLPTPTSRQLGGMLQKAERSVSRDWAKSEQWSHAAHAGLPAAIVKMADLIEMITFLTDDAVGPYSHQVRGALLAALEQAVAKACVGFPRYDWSVVQQVLHDADVLDEEGGV